MRITHFIPKTQDAQGALRIPHLVWKIPSMSTGEKIRQVREGLGLTLAEVEARAGLSDGTLSRIERGKQWLTEQKLYSIADALNISPAAFFTEPSIVADHIHPVAADAGDLDNLIQLDATAHKWLSLLHGLGSEDIAEFSTLIKKRQERNLKLIDELENKMHPPYYMQHNKAEEISDETRKKKSS